MAEIEEGDSGDKAKARDWMNRAVRAPREPLWTADGITADEWEPLSPVTGRLDAFEWRVPTSAVATRTNGALPPAVAKPEPPPPATVPATVEPPKPQPDPLALPEA
jgi:HemY protein